ncbi:hypothetical protein EGT51_07175 [Levilactobacillus suantsaiihabitans]|uniref:Uncharacterized protein n=1 Tax=Levilactobacillus suantsaiihabitans TaxID=2487722 RepID=A0A4Z0J7L2_9LACO|nr:hypothetical protein EGT51_07175 [Levilactobacillus suantsaiihabitans]
MAPAVSTQLPGVVCQVSAWDDFGDWRVMPGFKASRKPASGLQAVPIAGRIPGSRRHWFPPTQR